MFKDCTGQFKMMPNRTIMITSGDTLWNISQSLTGNGANWKKLGYKGDPNKLKVGEIFKLSSSLPLKGEPNSVGKRYGKDGKLEQVRKYGPDGNAQKDIDYGHPQHHPDLKIPHEHDWKWNKGKPSRGKAHNSNIDNPLENRSLMPEPCLPSRVFPIIIPAIMSVPLPLLLPVI